MVIEYIRYVVEPDRSATFLTAYRQASTALAASAHCLGYELSQGVEEPQNWVLRIEWDSVAGHEQGFRTSPEFGSFFAAVQPFFGAIQEMKHYAATDVAGIR